MPISEVFNINCLEYMKNVPEKYFELAIVDPPYGMNHSFMPFTAKQEKLYLKFREKYDLIHNKNNNL